MPCGVNMAASSDGRGVPPGGEEGAGVGRGAAAGKNDEEEKACAVFSFLAKWYA